MADELDVNKMVAEFLNQNMEKLYQASKGVLKGAADSLRLHLDQSYSAYLSCVAERYSKAKSFLIRNEPTYLYRFYVPLSVSCGNISIDKASAAGISAINPFAVITGSAGSGKSMLMRHLFLDTIASKGKVPVYIELRELNQTDRSLIDSIRDAMHKNHFVLDDAYIDKALKAGHLARYSLTALTKSTAPVAKI
jgi:Cdc6-like AAA superfamily ATPase